MSSSEAHVSNSTFVVCGFPEGAMTCTKTSQATMSDDWPQGSDVPCASAKPPTTVVRTMADVAEQDQAFIVLLLRMPAQGRQPSSIHCLNSATLSGGHAP